MNKRYFEGLNALRFFAAALVVLFHVHINQAKFDLPMLPDLAILFKGREAVLFFFTLSGFLITYLLLGERTKTGDISISKFYMRRVLRIWPLYYIIVIFGLFFYFFLLPQLGIAYSGMNFDLGIGVLCYTLFLPNLIYGLYHVGGIIGITWSIGVEEQYYLFWAPLVRRFFHRMLPLLIVMFVITTLLQVANAFNLFGLSEGMQKFVSTLQFNYMAVGGLFAYAYFYHRERLLGLPVFSNQLIQALLLVGLVAFFFFYHHGVPPVVITLLLPFAFGWLILNVSANESRRLIKLTHPVLDWLGKISYGIYMYHYIFVYLTSFLFTKFGVLTEHVVLFHVLYHLMVWSLTLGTAHFSFYHVESRILKLKHRFDV
jgi:peptidoglycan/LPS O-acetylase OafA/YrhL